MPATASDLASKAEQLLAGPHASGEILFGVEPGVDPASTSAGAIAGEILSVAIDTYKLRVPWWFSTKAALMDLLQDPLVRYAEPNYRLDSSETPTDTLFSDQWGLQDTEFGANALGAWSMDVTGRGDVFVAVLDSGVQTDHPDIAPNIWVNQDELNGTAGVDDDLNGFVDDIHGYNFFADSGDVYEGPSGDVHGTHVSGIIGASANGLGTVGVAQNVKIISVKFIDGDNGGDVDDAIAGLDYVLSLKQNLGLNIVATNNSYGSAQFSQGLLEAIQRQGDEGILFVAAAGNEDQDNDQLASYPANFDCSTEARAWDCVLSVAALTEDGYLTSFSNYGATTVDLAAPGEEILSDLPGTQAGYLSGTSMAAPFVTGAAVLCASANLALTGQQIAEAITSNLKPIQPLHNGLMANDGTLDVAATVADCLTSASNLGDSEISGQLLEAGTGNPVGSAEVKLQVEYYDEADQYQYFELSDTTDASGQFNFFRLPVGSFQLTSMGTSDGTEGDYFSGSRSFSIYESAIRQVDLTLDPIPSGTASISGRVIDEDGDPIQYINVGAFLVSSVDGDTSISGIQYATVTASDGTFQVSNLPAGTFQLLAAEDGFDMPQITRQEPIFESEYVVLEESTTSLSIADIVMPLVLPGSSTVRVQVWDEAQGSAAEQAQMCLRSDDGIVDDCETTDSDGFVEFTQVPAGNLVLFPSYFSDLSYEEQLSFVLAEGEVLQLSRFNVRSIDQADTSASLRVLVRDADSLAPIDNGNVDLWFLNTSTRLGPATVSASGEAVFSGIPQGTYTISAASEFSALATGQNLTVSVEAGENQASVLLHQIEFLGELSGTVLDGYGVPVEGATIWATFNLHYGCCEGEGVGDRAITDSNGYYRMSRVPLNQDLEITLDPPGTNRNVNTLAPLKDEIRLTSASPAVVRDFIVPDQGEIEGRVNLGSVGYSGAQVVAQDAETGEEFGATITAGGLFTIRDLKPGDYIVAVRPQDMETPDPIGAGYIKRVSSTTAELVYSKSEASVFSVAGSTTLNLPDVSVSKGARLKAQINFAAQDVILRRASRAADVVIYRENESSVYEEFGALGETRAYGYRLPSLELSGLPEGNYKFQFVNQENNSATFVPLFHDGATTIEDSLPVQLRADDVVTISPLTVTLSPPSTTSTFDLASVASEELLQKKDKIDVAATSDSTSVYVGTEFAGQYVAPKITSELAQSNFSTMSISDWALVDQRGVITFEAFDGGTLGIADAQDRLIGWAEVADPTPPVITGGGGGGGFFPAPITLPEGVESILLLGSIPSGAVVELNNDVGLLVITGTSWSLGVQVDQDSFSDTGVLNMQQGQSLALELSGLAAGSSLRAAITKTEFNAAGQPSQMLLTSMSTADIAELEVSEDGSISLAAAIPTATETGDYLLTVSGTDSLSMPLEVSIPISVTQAVDVSFKAWTRKLDETQAKMYAKNPAGVGKVQFFHNGKEIAWVRDEDGSDPKLRQVTEGPMAGVNYLVRTVNFVNGKNALEIYVDGERVWRAAYTLN